MPKNNIEEGLKLVVNCCKLAEVDDERIQKKVKKRMDGEAEIIEKLKHLFWGTGEIDTGITLQQQSEIKDKVIIDVNHHVFECMETWSLWSI